MEGYWAENDIDHDNRIRWDDRFKNLRHKSRQCNNINKGITKANNSGVVGVYYESKRNRWKSHIKFNHKTIYLGRYKVFDDAVCARLAAEQCLGWPNCNTTSSAYLYLKEQGVL